MKRLLLLSLVLVGLFAPRALGVPGQEEVTLPYTEYQRMHDELKAARIARDRLKARVQPAVASLNTANYRAVVQPGDLEIAVELKVTTHGTGQATIPLFDQSAVIVGAELPAGAGLIPGGVGERTTLRVAAPGHYLIRLRLAVAAPERNRATFTVPRSAAATFAISLAGSDAAARITPSAGEKRVVAGGRTSVEVALPATEEVSVEWSATARGPATATGPQGRLYLQSFTVITVEPHVLRGRTLLRYDVRGGVAGAFHLALPDSMRVLEARGEAISGWEAIEAGEKHLLRVDPASTVTGGTEFIVEWEAPIGAAELVELPRPRGAGVEREAVIIGASAGEGVEIEPAAIERMTPVDPENAPPELAALAGKTPGYIARQAGGDGRMALSIRRTEAVAVVAARIEELTGRSVGLTSGRVVTELAARVRNSTVDFLEIVLPAGAALWTVDVDGHSVLPLRGEKPDAVRIPLVRSTDAGGGGALFDVVIIYAEDHPDPRLVQRIVLAPPVFSLEIGKLSWSILPPEGARRLYLLGDLWRDYFDLGEWRSAASVAPATHSSAISSLPVDAARRASISFTRHALPANATAQALDARFLLAPVGPWMGWLLFLAGAVFTWRLLSRACIAKRDLLTAAGLALVMLSLQWLFGGAFSRLVQGIVVALIAAGARYFLKGGGKLPKEDSAVA